MNEPRHEHDCDCCTYLGHFEKYDLYHCAHGGNPTVIARYGDDGDYMSGMCFAGQVKPLGVAKERALAKGLNCNEA
jgi:hypothetical protein